jgi:hypothetical protein
MHPTVFGPVDDLVFSKLQLFLANRAILRYRHPRGQVAQKADYHAADSPQKALFSAL